MEVEDSSVRAADLQDLLELANENDEDLLTEYFDYTLGLTDQDVTLDGLRQRAEHIKTHGEFARSHHCLQHYTRIRSHQCAVSPWRWEEDSGMASTQY